MKQEIFSKVTLENKTEAFIIEGKGLHFFNAMNNCKGNTALLFKYLIMELVFIRDKKITEKELNNMHMKDVSYLTEVIGLMMSNDYKNI